MASMKELTYRVYSTTPGCCTFASLDHSCHLEADSFDVFSRHFGLYSDDRLGADLLVGGIRLTGFGESPAASAFRDMCAPHDGLMKRIMKSRPAILPMGAYLQGWPIIEAQIHRVVDKGERVVEPGRLVLDPAWRGSTRRLAVFIVECAIAAWLADGTEHAVLCCTQAHTAIYGAYGFRPIPGIGAVNLFGNGTPCLPLWLSRDQLPEAVLSRCSALAYQLSHGGQIRLEHNRTSRPMRAGRPQVTHSTDVAA